MGNARAIATDQTAHRLSGVALLCELLRKKNACRLALGRLGATFLAQSGQHRLGFAQVGDYTKEELGISRRRLQEEARVARELAQLPVLEAAFLEGAVSWSKVRMLAGFVTPENEGGWVPVARASTVDSLRARIELAAEGGSASSGPAVEEAPGQIDGEPATRVAAAVPALVEAQWRRTQVVASLMCGAPIAPWQTAECVAAEVEGRGPVTGGDPRKQDASRVAWSARAVQPRAERPRSAGKRAVADCDGERELADALRVAGALPDAILKMSEGVHDSARELHRRMKRIVREEQGTQAALGRVLCFLKRWRGWQEWGCASFDDLVVALGLAPATARELIGLHRDLERLPRLGQAFRTGVISLAKAKVVGRVATAATVESWLMHAGCVTARRLADDARAALDQRDLTGVVDVWPGRPGETRQAASSTARICARALRMTGRIDVVGPRSVMKSFAAQLNAHTLPGDAGWEAAARVLAKALGAWLDEEQHSNPIFRRDGFRCAAPGCTRCRDLQEHHIVFRSQGGGNQRWNRITLCWWHHQRAIHLGIIRLRGKAPGELQWEFPLRRYEGDAYRARQRTHTGP